VLPGFEKTQTNPKPRRFQIKFWLRNTGDESAIGAELDALRARRKMKPTIVAALKLWFDLARGNTGELRRAFPSIVADIERHAESPANAEFALMLEQQAQILEQQAAILAQQPMLPGFIGEQATTAPRLSAPALELPRIEEDEESLTGMIEIKRDTSTDCAANFLHSILALNA